MNLESLLPDAPASEQIVHFYAALSIPWPAAGAITVSYGDEIIVTEEIRELGKDRRGRSWLDLLDNPDEQVRKFGLVRYAPGPWPEGMSRLKPGSQEEFDAHAKAFRDAWSLPTDEERAAALAEARRTFGDPPSMVHNMGQYT